MKNFTLHKRTLYNASLKICGTNVTLQTRHEWNIMLKYRPGETTNIKVKLSTSFVQRRRTPTFGGRKHDFVLQYYNKGTLIRKQHDSLI